jgi:hypothetical protein
MSSQSNLSSLSNDIENHIISKHKMNQLGGSNCLEIRNEISRYSHILTKPEYEKVVYLIDKYCPDEFGFKASER